MQDALSDMQKEFIGFINPLPDAAREFLDLVKKTPDETSTHSNILLRDSLLSSRIFEYINRTLNTGKSRYISLNKGIAQMGLHRFKNIVLVFSLYPFFQEADCIELFKYSLSCGCRAKEIALEYGFINPDDAFLLGFLHDIGKVILKNKYGEKYQFASNFKEDFDRKYAIENETARFKFAHPDVGEYLCKTWLIPIVITDAIKFHHSPLAAMLPNAASIVYVTDYLYYKNTRMTAEDSKIFQYLRLTKDELSICAQKGKGKDIPFYEILNI